MELENLRTLMDPETENVAGYATTADTYNTYHCIIGKDSTDLGNALEDTLHRLLSAGATPEDIHRVLGAEIMSQADLDLMNDEIQGYIVIDLGYVIPGELIYYQSCCD